MKRGNLIYATLTTLCVVMTQAALASSYLDDIRERYQDIFVVSVASSKTVVGASGAKCFFQYDSSVLENWRGHYVKATFSFYSQLGLETGGDYLIYFSPSEATTFRHPVDGPHDECARKMDGYFLLYGETNRVKKYWDGSHFVDVINFSDGSADFFESQTRDEIEHLVDLAAVKRSIQGR